MGCEHVTFRLYPYLIDYQIDPVEIFPNTPIVDSVDFWTVNRINPDSVPFARYYEVNPLMEDQGFYEQISHAVARVSNVEGGLLHVKVMCDKLAISEWAYIDGEIYGLVSNSADDLDFDADHGHDHDGLLSPANKMQSGRFPFIYQNVMDHRESEYQPECLGCSDFCCSMTFDDLDQYTRINLVQSGFHLVILSGSISTLVLNQLYNLLKIIQFPTLSNLITQEITVSFNLITTV